MTRTADVRLGGVPSAPGAPRVPVLDLRGPAPAGRDALLWPSGERVVVSGLPGSGKSTLMRRVTGPGGTPVRVDSQDARERWARRLPRPMPYPLYRPLARLAHYATLWRALRSPASVLVHDCGRSSLVRRWLSRDAHRRGRGVHLLLLDVPARTALAGQAERGRGVSRRAFRRHEQAMAGLLAEISAGRLPPGCDSVTLLDRAAAQRLHEIGFTGDAPCTAP